MYSQKNKARAYPIERLLIIEIIFDSQLLLWIFCATLSEREASISAFSSPLLETDQ